MTILERIREYKAAEVAERKAATPAAEIEARARAADPVRPFRLALAAAEARGRYGLIAEIKKASPSKGLIRADFTPAALARAYADGGASCLSVLTDAPSFQGAEAHLAEARAAVPLPVLRKDFLLDPWQVAESRALGADAVLIIMAFVDDACAAEIEAAALGFGMDALVEVHDDEEIERALRLKSGMIGINNRDLRTFETELETTERLAGLVPEDRLLVAESGMTGPADLARLARSGVRSFLIGEALMRADDVAQATRAMLANPLPRGSAA